MRKRYLHSTYSHKHALARERRNKRHQRMCDDRWRIKWESNVMKLFIDHPIIYKHILQYTHNIHAISIQNTSASMTYQCIKQARTLFVLSFVLHFPSSNVERKKKKKKKYVTNIYKSLVCSEYIGLFWFSFALFCLFLCSVGTCALIALLVFLKPGKYNKWSLRWLRSLTLTLHLSLHSYSVCLVYCR